MSQAMNDERNRAYWDAILRRVCSVCLDQADDGSCGLTRRRCAIQGHLPAVVQAVASTQSDRMADYEAAIRAQVCAPCGKEDEQGRCEMRDRGECALDTYLYLVVEAVEEVNDALGVSAATPVS